MNPVLIAALAVTGLLIAKKAMASSSPTGGCGSVSNFLPSTPRDANIWELLAAGQVALPDFTTVQSERDGHIVEIYAANDALRMGLGGYRMMVSHELAQALADATGTILPTTRMSDMAFLSVPPAQRLGPVTSDSDVTMDDEATAQKTSAQIDQAMVGKGVPVGGFVRCVGKEWVTSEKLLEDEGTPPDGCLLDFMGRPIANVRSPVQGGVQKRFPGTVAGANFGWQWSQGSSKTPGGLPCVQSVGRRHGTDHFDYSQLLTLYQPTCSIDGTGMNVEDVLLNPELAYLLSDEVVKGQACRVTRHPAFPRVG